MRLPATLLLLFAIRLQAAPVLQSVEFPFATYPREYWDRELVWMKNIGIQNVALQVSNASEEPDVLALLRTMRKLGLTAWVRLQPGASGMEKTLDPFTKLHGGPISYFGSAAPQPVTRLSALSAASLAMSRSALESTGGTLLWTDVEETLTPDYKRGAISFSGEESPTTAALRRDALLVAYWQEGLAAMTDSHDAKAVSGPLPEGVSARQVTGPGGAGPSAVNVTNTSKLPFRGELRVLYPPAKRNIALPAVEVPAGESLWLPVNIPLAKGPFCKNCDALGNEDSIVYATAELTGAEYENGILALEFSAPKPGEILLHLSKEPSGPLVAGGKPESFDWDASSGRVRLQIPAGRGPGARVRVGLALEPPESSAFFDGPKVLIIGQTNTVSTNYSSEAIAGRSRLRAPANLKYEAIPKGPLQIDYAIAVPPDALHGDHLELALEADGVQMGHVRLQLLRAASLRVREAVNRHFGTAAELPIFPALVSMDQRAGRNISVTIRNNFPEIKNYVLELSGDGLDFSPSLAEISIGASSERDVTVRVFPRGEMSGVRSGLAKLSGAGSFELPVQFSVVPRGETVSYSAGGVYVVESAKIRAVFADSTLRKWLEFTWKDSERNVLPENGIDFGPGQRQVTLKDTEMAVEQQSPLPVEKLKAGKKSDLTLQIQHPQPNRTLYMLSR